MDRRQRKTRESIYNAFITLLSKKHYNQITVEQILEIANVGRATFYAHFETKDFLLKNLCEELFCHVFDCLKGENDAHQHIFKCNSPGDVILHLFKHLEKNDNNILRLLSCPNNELFLSYFKSNLTGLIKSQVHLFENKKSPKLPENFWVNHICSTFVETVKWWVDNGKQESCSQITDYFFTVI